MNMIYSGMLEDADREIKNLTRVNTALEVKLEKKNRETDRLYKRIAVLESCLELSENENIILRKSKNTGAYNFMDIIDYERTGSHFEEENVRQISDRICETEKENTEPDHLRQRSEEMCNDFDSIDLRMAGLSNDYTQQKDIIKALINDTKALYESYGKLRKTKFNEFLEERKRIKGVRKVLLAKKKELEKQYAGIGKVVTDLDAIRETVKKSVQRFSSCVGCDNMNSEEKEEREENAFSFSESYVITSGDSPDTFSEKEQALNVDGTIQYDNDSVEAQAEKERTEGHDSDTDFSDFDDFSPTNSNDTESSEDLSCEMETEDVHTDEMEEEKECPSTPVRRTRRNRK